MTGYSAVVPQNIDLKHMIKGSRSGMDLHNDDTDKTDTNGLLWVPGKGGYGSDYTHEMTTLSVNEH